MHLDYLTTTLIKGWQDDCPSRAIDSNKIRMEEGDDETGQSPTVFGTIVHNTAQEYHEYLMREEDPPPAIELFEAHWQAAQLGDLSYFDLGRSNIEEFLERTIFDRKGETIGAEIPFLLDLGSDDPWIEITHGWTRQEVAEVARKMEIPVASKIDRIDRVSESEFEIYDYKTNVLPFSRDQVDNSTQLVIYDLAVRAMYPEAEDVRCTFDMLRHGRFSTIFDEERRELLRAYICATWLQIAGADEAEERLNPFCAYCHRKHNCKAYGEAVSNDYQTLDPLTADAADVDLFTMYEDLKSREKILSKRADEIKARLVGKIVDANDGKPLVLGDGRELYLQSNPRYEYNTKAVYEVLKQQKALILLRDVANISTKGLERALKGRPKLEDILKPMKDTFYVSPTLKARKATSEPTSEKKGKKKNGKRKSKK